MSHLLGNQLEIQKSQLRQASHDQLPKNSSDLEYYYNLYQNRNRNLDGTQSAYDRDLAFQAWFRKNHFNKF